MTNNKINQTNRFIQEAAPWNYVSKANKDAHAAEQSVPVIPEQHRPHVDRTIFLCAESLRLAAILLLPYMPQKAAQLLDMLGVDEFKRSFEFAAAGKDVDYGVSKVKLGKVALFPPIETDELPTK